MSRIGKSEKLTELREQRRLDRYALAEEAELHPSVITRLEKGEQSDFKVSVLVKVAAALGVSVDSLVETQVIETGEHEVMLPDLQQALTLLRRRPYSGQLQVAAIIMAYISKSNISE